MLSQKHIPQLRQQPTAHLAQTMSLLELTSGELKQKIESDLASNPALELLDIRHCPHCQRPLATSGACPVCASSIKDNQSEPIIFVSPTTDFQYSRSNNSENSDSQEEWIAETPSLPTYVFRQIAPELDPDDRPIAAFILTSLDEDGLLRVPLYEIALYHHVPISRVEGVLELIQHADPVGVGSPTPQAALLVQLDVLSESRPVPELAYKAVEDGFQILSRRSYELLGRFLDIPISVAEELSNFISTNLNPYPARAHWGENNQKSPAPQVYQQADIIISASKETTDTPFIVEIVSPYSGCLRVNPLFKEALNQAPVDKTDEWREDYEHANLLVKCLQQRNNTIIRLVEKLVTHQRQFILEGEAKLIPMTRAQLAKELNLHESTVSRAVSNKAVQLPNQRIIPLSRMFERSLNVRTVMQEIIKSEEHPLSDMEIVSRLGARGYHVARRTVAKYRSLEGILPGRLRNSNKKTSKHLNKVSQSRMADHSGAKLTAPRT